MLLLVRLLGSAEDIYALGADAVAGYKAIVAAAKLKTGSPEEQAALSKIDARLIALDAEVATAPEPDER